MKANVILGAACLIAGVLLGGVAGLWIERQSQDERLAAAVQKETARAERLGAEVSELQERGTLLELHLRLGRIAVEADQQDYGTAGDRAARLFDDLARLDSETEPGDPERPALRHVLAARDEVTAGLATGEPATAEKLGQLYLDVFSMMQLPSFQDAEVPEEAGY